MWFKLLLVSMLIIQPLFLSAQIQQYKGYPTENPNLRSEYIFRSIPVHFPAAYKA